jgi:hypothetical protein
MALCVYPSVCVCAFVCGRMCVCVCVCERERERENKGEYTEHLKMYNIQYERYLTGDNLKRLTMKFSNYIKLLSICNCGTYNENRRL